MEGLKCVSMALGELSVMTSGTAQMPVWSVGSWGTLHMVSCFVLNVLIWQENQLAQNTVYGHWLQVDHHLLFVSAPKC